MKHIKPVLASTAIVLLSLFSGAVTAQTSPAQTTLAKSDLTDGVVKKIDKESGKITLKHGEIKHLEMPPMTMVFVVKDKSMLDTVKAGDKVRFMVIEEKGQMRVTDLQPGS